MPAKTKRVKRVAAAPLKTTKPAPKKTANVLIEKRPKNFGIGADVQPKRDLSRFVRWPKYIRLQRQKRILQDRLKVPPSINQFSQTLDQQTAIQLFKLMHKYRPETKAEKKDGSEADLTRGSEIKSNKSCRYFNRGHCRSKNECRFAHPSQICSKYVQEGKCEGQSCADRHPKLCIWMKATNGCRRQNCDFLHVRK